MKFSFPKYVILEPFDKQILWKKCGNFICYMENMLYNIFGQKIFHPPLLPGWSGLGGEVSAELKEKY